MEEVRAIESTEAVMFLKQGCGDDDEDVDCDLLHLAYFSITGIK